MPRSSAGVPGGLPGPGVAGVRSRHLGLRPVPQRRRLGRLHQLAARLGRRCQRVGRLLPGGPAPPPARRRPRPCCRPTPPGNLLRGPPGTASIGHGQFPLSADNATATPVVSLVRPCLSGPLRLAAVLVLSSGSCTSCAASRCWAVRADLRRACGPQCRRAQRLAASAASVRCLGEGSSTYDTASAWPGSCRGSTDVSRLSPSHPAGWPSTWRGGLRQRRERREAQ